MDLLAKIDNPKFKLSEIFDKKVDYQGPLVYRIHNLITGKSYIGSTKMTLLDRFINFTKDNRSHYQGYLNKSIHLYNSMRNYGIENFEVEILFASNSVNIRDMETEYIRIFDSFNSGYNQSNSGYGGGAKSTFHNSEWQSIQGHKGGIKVRDEKLGIFKIPANIRNKGINLKLKMEKKGRFSSDTQKKLSEKGCKRCKELGVGVFNPKVRSKAGKLGNLVLKEKGLGVCYNKEMKEEYRLRARAKRINSLLNEFKKRGLSFSRENYNLVKEELNKRFLLKYETIIRALNNKELSWRIKL